MLQIEVVTWRLQNSDVSDFILCVAFYDFL